jgi:hypothetical protein
MSDDTNVEVAEEQSAEEATNFSIEISISNQNLQYRSDFNEGETIFWLEAVKSLIINNTFNKVNLSSAS